MVELKVNHPQNVPGDISIRLPNPSIRKPQTDHLGPSFSRILASRVAPAAGDDNIAIAIHILAVPHLEPAENLCAVTSLAMVLKYYGIYPGYSPTEAHNAGLPVYNGMSADTPEEVHDLAEAFGVRAGVVHNGNINDLVNLIDNGIPPIIFGGEGGSGHCVVVCGYEKDATGQVTKVYLNDPNRAVDVEMSYEEFMQFWSLGSPGGSDNKYIVLAKPGTPQYDYLASVQPNCSAGGASSNCSFEAPDPVVQLGLGSLLG